MFRRTGFSLIELTIVLALSLTMMGVISGMYVQRRNVANDDAAQQIASIIQTVRNDAVQGLGPSSSRAKNGFSAGTTLYGEAIKFSNNCSGKPCMHIYKLKLNNDGSVAYYEDYYTSSPQLFSFNLVDNTNDTLVFKTGTGSAYFTTDPTVVPNPISGDVVYNLQTGLPSGDVNNSNSWTGASVKYNISVSLTGVNAIGVKRL